jgi:hypothetical protein
MTLNLMDERGLDAFKCLDATAEQQRAQGDNDPEIDCSMRA